MLCQHHYFTSLLTFWEMDKCPISPVKMEKWGSRETSDRKYSWKNICMTVARAVRGAPDRGWSPCVQELNLRGKRVWEDQVFKGAEQAQKSRYTGKEKVIPHLWVSLALSSFQGQWNLAQNPSELGHVVTDSCSAKGPPQGGLKLTEDSNPRRAHRQLLKQGHVWG